MISTTYYIPGFVYKDEYNELGFCSDYLRAKQRIEREQALDEEYLKLTSPEGNYKTYFILTMDYSEQTAKFRGVDYMGKSML
jgi:hypothetical protein